MTSELEQSHPAPGEAPEEAPRLPPEGAPPWPAWYAPAAFVTGIFLVFVVAAVIQVIVAAAGHDFPSSGAGIALGGTLIQDAILAAAAVLFASRVAPPRPWQFGLRGTPLRGAVRAALTAYAAFWLFSVIYQVALHPHGKQTVAKDLGANNGGVLLVLAALLVIVVAPVAEEFFFRGFFYRALRTRFPILLAALIDALVFGAVHYTGAQTLAVLPALAMLGFVFCLLYERTNSILPGISLHAFNNSISYAVTVHSSGGVALALGVAMIGACAAAPRVLPALREPAAR
ncbi:MAG TPA: CPBP family intramembrane glutamic endopeptidase [Thermoleophilaceae bacterium]